MKRELTRSAVSFDAATHTYHMGDVILGGVTPIVKWAYPDTYRDIPEDVLRRAAEHGTSVHQDCQMADAGLPCTSREAQAYLRMKAERGLETLANEWLVDDGGNIASHIDVVFTDCSIADIKATSVIHRENVTLQLSIYAWLLERMNPGLTVPRLFVIWLPRQMYGEPEMMELVRIPSEKCGELVAAYLEGKPSAAAADILGTSKEVVPAYNLPQELRDLEAEIIRLELEAKAIKERNEQLKQGLLRVMEEKRAKKYESERLVITYTEPYEQAKLDSARLKKEMPEIYRAYCKMSQCKGSVRIKVKDIQ